MGPDKGQVHTRACPQVLALLLAGRVQGPAALEGLVPVVQEDLLVLLLLLVVEVAVLWHVDPQHAVAYRPHVGWHPQPLVADSVQFVLAARPPTLRLGVRGLIVAVLQVALPAVAAFVIPAVAGGRSVGALVRAQV